MHGYYRLQKHLLRRKSGSGASEDVPFWKFFHFLTFLDDSLEPRSTHTVIEELPFNNYEDTVPDNNFSVLEESLILGEDSEDSSVNTPSTSRQTPVPERRPRKRKN